jgi:DNA-binding LytR/AlgR family response regulator
MEFKNVIKKYIVDFFREHGPDGKNAECVLYSTAEAMLQSFQKDGIDIFFLDIELDEGQLGFDLARQLCNIQPNTPIIYMTNHAHYVSKAFVCRPLGFIRKKYIEQDIRQPMMEAIRLLSEREAVIEFKNGKKELQINISKVYAIEVFNHRMDIILRDQTLKIADQLSHYIQELENHGFIIVRRGVMLNLAYVQSINGYVASLYNGKTYEMSKDKAEDIRREWLYYKMT